MTKTTKAPRPKGSAAKKSTPAPAAPSLLPDPSTAESTGLTLAEAEASTSEITFADLGLSERLAAQMPAGQTWVAESAIRRPEDVARMAAAGASAVLVGEGLLKAPDIGAHVRAFSGVPRRKPGGGSKPLPSGSVLSPGRSR